MELSKIDEEPTTLPIIENLIFSGIRVDTVEELNKYYDENILNRCVDSYLKAHPETFLQMFKRYLGMQLISDYESKNSIKFDCVILVRPDVVLSTFDQVNFETLHDTIYFNNVFLPDETMVDESIIISTKDNILTFLELCMQEFIECKYVDSNSSIPHKLQKNILLNVMGINMNSSKLLKYILRPNNWKIHITN